MRVLFQEIGGKDDEFRLGVTECEDLWDFKCICRSDAQVRAGDRDVPIHSLYLGIRTMRMDEIIRRDCVEMEERCFQDAIRNCTWKVFLVDNRRTLP